MAVETIEQLRDRLTPVSAEISVVTPFRSPACRAGLVAFQPRPGSGDGKWITHQSEEVVGHVLEGRGWLRLPDQEVPLAAGTICHIPVGTAHDIVAGGRRPLLMLYISVSAQPPAGS